MTLVRHRPAALVIGGGPAGLMAADVLSSAGHDVLIADQKPSFGRKFLMAGKSGLNLTKQEDVDAFLSRYDSDWLWPMVSDFGPQAVQAWAQGLGQDLFTGSTGRVFPKVMKASPLLRAWLARLEAQRVDMRRRWRWLGWEGETALFETPDGRERVDAQVTVLALGGGSWARLGSDGLWVALPAFDGQTAPFVASNTGLMVPWSAHMRPHLGAPIKAVRWSVREAATGAEIATSRGEAVLSERGLEGGGLYPLIPALRAEGRVVVLDLAPDLDGARLSARLSAAPKSLTKALRNRLRWPAQKVALFHEFRSSAGAMTPEALASEIKTLRVAHAGPRPIDEAISTAGGLRQTALTETLEFRDRPGVYACGEMLDWDAPTGGYLLTACLATGRCAGRAAAERLSER